MLKTTEDIYIRNESKYTHFPTLPMSTFVDFLPLALELYKLPACPASIDASTQYNIDPVYLFSFSIYTRDKHISSLQSTVNQPYDGIVSLPFDCFSDAY